jgi:hypothetical protein
VPGQARAAECVRAGGAAAVRRGGRHGLHADAAGVVVLLRPVGSRHSAVGGTGKGGGGRREVQRAGAWNRRESLRLTGFLLRGISLPATSFAGSDAGLGSQVQFGF